MTVKFKVGFIITGETLFGLIAKMLPIENLEVEEIPLIRPEKTLAERAIAIHEPKPKPKRKRASPGPDLTKGINGILVVALKDKSMRPIELQSLIKAAGFSPTSINSRLIALRKHGVVSPAGDGHWKLNAT